MSSDVEAGLEHLADTLIIAREEEHAGSVQQEALSSQSLKSQSDFPRKFPLKGSTPKPKN
jgi:hypothetical protein